MYHTEQIFITFFFFFYNFFFSGIGRGGDMLLDWSRLSGAFEDWPFIQRAFSSVLAFPIPNLVLCVQIIDISEAVFICRVESPRDRGPYTPPLRGNKYEVVPPVKPRQAFVRYVFAPAVLNIVLPAVVCNVR